MGIVQVGVKCLLVTGSHAWFLALRRASGMAQQHEEFDIPGGRLDFGEEPLTGLVREIAEEVGLSFPSEDGFVLLDAGNIVATAERHIVRLTYARVLDHAVDPALSDEHTAWCWRMLEESEGHHPLLNRAIRTFRQRRE